MATQRQVLLYESLCEEIGQEPDDTFENLTINDASKAIDELYELKRTVN